MDSFLITAVSFTTNEPQSYVFGSKKHPLHISSWEQVFANYPYISKGVWSIFTTDKEKEIVRFTANYDVKAITNDFTVPNLAEYEDTRSPMIIYTVKDIEYYDQKQDIYLKLDYEVTDKPDSDMDTVYLGREQVVENLGNAKILYKNAMRVPLTTINNKEFYNTLINDSYISIYFSDEKAGAIGMFIGIDNQKTELSPHSATPAIEFQEYLDKFFIKKSANAPAPNTTREEIYINGLQEKNGVINVSYCISETDICDTLYAKKGTEAYNFIKSNDVLYKTFFCDIDNNGMIAKIISPTSSNASSSFDFIGTYKYQEEGFSGGMKISLANNGVQIDLDTASEYTGNTCGVEALLCTVEGKTILCPSEEQGFDPIIITIINNKTVEIIQGSNTYYCGMNGSFLGKYMR